MRKSSIHTVSQILDQERTQENEQINLQYRAIRRMISEILDPLIQYTIANNPQSQSLHVLKQVKRDNTQFDRVTLNNWKDMIHSILNADLEIYALKDPPDILKWITDPTSIPFLPRILQLSGAQADASELDGNLVLCNINPPFLVGYHKKSPIIFCEINPEKNPSYEKVISPITTISSKVEFNTPIKIWSWDKKNIISKF